MSAGTDLHEMLADRLMGRAASTLETMGVGHEAIARACLLVAVAAMARGESIEAGRVMLENVLAGYNASMGTDEARH
ncbi:hypothetical protein KHC23_12345 [Ancylobacter dichloromethanicus]|uniref:Uncharacterized protein n=1 Tax=Ancylobacter dichloromethanicus TaxID=518825 RepID=A0A9W6J734_9HYPH|nr:hypothetical protein [Ancylobacter dichloromethanicus]MBS7554444.1 hypothetical protein [Ancylobacter dichloromethanicus]GLK71572.1 hypothetical protein GCM10017643_16870 [Ancylobacter dichloromethanicus]